MSALRAGSLVAVGTGALTAAAALEVARLRRVPRLPETAVGLDRLILPAATHETSAGPPVAMAVLGDSLVAGVGVPVAEAALPVRLAELVADALGRPVRLRTYGRSGARAVDVLASQIPELAEGAHVDVVVVAVGVNDATRLVTARRHAREIRRIVEEIRRTTEAPVVLCGVPDVRAFRAMSGPVRTLVRVEASLLHAVQRRVAGATGGGFVERVPAIARAFERQRELMASDRYHPSPVGVTVLAAVAAPAVTAAVTCRDRARRVS